MHPKRSEPPQTVAGQSGGPEMSGGREVRGGVTGADSPGRAPEPADLPSPGVWASKVAFVSVRSLWSPESGSSRAAGVCARPLRGDLRRGGGAGSGRRGRRPTEGGPATGGAFVLRAEGGAGSGCPSSGALPGGGELSSKKPRRCGRLGPGAGARGCCCAPLLALPFLPHQRNRKENVSWALCSVLQPAAAPICWSQRSF